MATAVLATEPPLADGEHELRLWVSDRAGNEKQVTKTFRLDRQAPAAAVIAPVPGGFTNDRTPEIRVTLRRPAGLGRRSGLGTDLPPEGHGRAGERGGAAGGPGRGGEAVVVVPESLALADGSYRVRVTLADAAGNAGAVESGFTVDTVAPRYWIETPTRGQWLGTKTPAFSVRFEEEASGVDPARFGFAVDGTELGARFTVECPPPASSCRPVSATGALLPEDALAEGEHSATVEVFDRAGNAGVTSDPVPFPFAVDVTPPTLAVVLPAPGSYLGAPVDRLRLEYADTGSGIVPESVEVTVDGQAPSREDWTVTAAAAEGPVAIGDGAHALVAKVRDGAGNTTTVPAGFTVDTQPPVVTLDTPADGTYHKTSPTLTGTVVDADPQVSVRCLREAREATREPRGAGDGRRGHGERGELHVRAAARRRGERGSGRGARPSRPHRPERAPDAAPRHDPARASLHRSRAGQPGGRGHGEREGRGAGRLADRVGAHRGAGSAGQRDDVHGGGGAGGGRAGGVARR